jgi:hypothetical protein
LQVTEKRLSSYQVIISMLYVYNVSHDIASSEKWCQCLDKKVQDFSVVKQIISRTVKRSGKFIK